MNSSEPFKELSSVTAAFQSLKLEVLVRIQPQFLMLSLVQW